VLWRSEVEDELAEIWINASDRPAVAAAADRIDAELRVFDPQRATDTCEGLKSIRIAPLTAYVHVDEADGKVFVEAVRFSTD
jgi:hypothetical protein